MLKFKIITRFFSQKLLSYGEMTNMNISYENKGKTIEVRTANFLTASLHFHSHIEIVYLLSGECMAAVGLKETKISAGDLFIALPNQPHSYKDLTPTESLLIILPKDFFDEYKSTIDIATLTVPIVRAKQCSETIKSIIESIYINAFDNRPYRKSIIKGYAQVLLGEILCSVSLKQNFNEAADDTVHRIIRYCLNNYRKNEISLNSVSKKLHLSKYYISHIFSQKVKMSFNDFINEMRIDEACRLLESDAKLSTTQIAYEVGFGSVRTFNRAFVKFKSVSPRNYKKEV